MDVEPHADQETRVRTIAFVKDTAQVDLTEEVLPTVDSDDDPAAGLEKRDWWRSTLPAMTSGTRASSIINESASSTSAKLNGRCTRAAASIASRSRRWSNPASFAVMYVMSAL